MRLGARWGGLAAAVLVTVVAGCGGSGGDKAGGPSREHPVLLTLESEDDVRLSGAPEFAAAVERLSGGSLRIDLVPAGRSTKIDFERGVVEDVHKGRAKLGIVGARVWDTMGVPSFRALLAPFLVNSYELERRVLERPLAEEMLAGVELAGVVGIALLPGPLRRPFGITRALVGPDDYRDATIAIRPAGVAGETLRALGSKPVGHVPGDLTGMDGAELDPTTFEYNGYDGQALTTNVVLWPKPFTIVMNREAFDALTGEQQDVLRRAGREAIVPELRQIERDEASAVGALCTGLTFVKATPADLAALRATAQPVYAELEGEERMRRQLAEIAGLKREAVPADLGTSGCRSDRSVRRAAGVLALEGTWETTWTRAALLAEGIAPKDAAALSGHHTAEFVRGRFRFRGDPGSGRSAVGTYTVEGDVIRLVFETGVALQLGRPYELRWSVYRDTLSFSEVQGSEPLLAFLTAPYTRVR